MIRMLLPRAQWDIWTGPAIGHEPHGPGCTRDVAGRCLSIAWLGLHVEFVIAREIGTCAPTDAAA